MYESFICGELITDIKFDLLRLWALFLEVLMVWLYIVPRKSWQDAWLIERLNKAWIKVNRVVGQWFITRNGEQGDRHVAFESGEG